MLSKVLRFKSCVLDLGSHGAFGDALQDLMALLDLTPGIRGERSLNRRLIGSPPGLPPSNVTPVQIRSIRPGELRGTSREMVVRVTAV